MNDTPLLNIALDPGRLAVVTFNLAHITGDQSAMQIAAELDRLLEAPPPRLILDFSGVEIINSALVGKIASVHKQMLAKDGRLVLCGMGRQLERIFTYTRLNTILTIVSDTDQAKGIE